MVPGTGEEDDDADGGGRDNHISPEQVAENLTIN